MRIKIIEQIISLDKNLELIGSNSNDEIVYKTDYDFQEVILKDPALFVPKIQVMFRELNKLKDAYIVDFKAGFYVSSPVRWSYSEITNGYKDIDDHRITLLECLQDLKSKVKIDVIAYIDGAYKEISCNYYFTDSNKPTDEIFLSLMLDIKKYHREKKYMKMFKRVYSYKIIKEEDVSELVEMFNSKIGWLYSVLHRVELLMFMLENNVVEPVNRFKLDSMRKKIYSELPDSLKQIQSLDDLKKNLSKLINKLLLKY